ncbi:hypothetical protein [Parafrigoribacterium mesophilum]|uniref:hypothetical protein n=1 Tax=Parafrigoribacterium mesophilum TaxID=433646 RepID=UPI0031FD397A
MSTFRNPVGPQPSGVYWRRRLMVGLGVLAVIVIIVMIITRPGSGDAAVKDPGASVSPSPTKSAAAAQKEGDPCVPASIKLEPVTDKGVYNAGENPLISMKITNTSTVACTMNAGSTLQQLRITSGSELIWSSKDCQKDPVDVPVILQPNTPQSTAPIPWDRTRSSAGTCDAERNKVKAGGASYHLSVLLGELKSAGTVQFILN